MRVIVTLLLLYLSSSFVYAQNVAQNEKEISIQVKEKGSGKTVRRAEVQVKNQKVFADKNGVATLKISSDEKSIDVTITRTGYESFKKTIEVLDKTSLDVFIISKQTQTTVVVSGKDDTSPSKKLISIDEAKRIAPRGDPANVVKLMPGVQVKSGFGGAFGRPGGIGATRAGTSNAASKPGTGTSGGRYIGPSSATSNSGVVIRGSPADDSRFFLDDFEIPIVYHSIVDLSVVPGSLLSDVQFEAGGFGSRYGNAGGGIIRLNTRSDIPETPSGEFVVNVPFYAGVYYRTKINETQAMSGSYRRSYIDAFLNALLKRQASRSGSGSFSIAPVAQDAHVMHTQKLDGGGTRKIMALYAEDGVKAVMSRNYSKGSDQSLSIDAYTRGLTLGVSQEGNLSEKTTYRTTPQYVYAKSSATISDSLTEISTYKLRMPTEFETSFSDSNAFIYGLDPEHTWIRQDTEIKSLPFFGSGSLNIEQRNNFKVGNPATWVGWRSRLNDLTLFPGARLFYNTQLKRVSLDPRMNMTYQLTPLHGLKSAVGQYSKAPSFDQASSEFGNPDLKYERTYHYILGVETKWNEAYTTEVQGFFKETYDVVQADRAEKYLNDGRREVYGIELFLRRNLTENFFGWGTYTYSKTTERAHPDEPFIRSPLDQTHVANIATSYRWAPTWEGSARYKYNTGGSYIPSTGGVYDSTRDQYSSLAVGGEENLPAQQSMTFYATKEYLQDTWKLAVRFGMESFWFKPMISSMRANYDKTKDSEVTSISNIPFLEIQGTL